jgi:hypothetical protein
VALPFKEAFADAFGCRPDAFSQEVLKRCLYPHARVIWPLLEFAGGPAVLAAQAYMDLIAATRSKDELLDAIDEYRDEIRPHSGFLARRLYLRVSVERLLGLHHFVRETEQRRALQMGMYHPSGNIYSGSTV